MLYEEFLQAVREETARALGGGYELTLRRVPKNNGLLLDGLCIRRLGDKVASAVYLNSSYDEYLNGRGISSISAEILSLFRANRTPEGIDYNLLSDFEAMKPRLACRFVNAASNQGLLEHVPCIPWLDLALVFYLLLGEDEKGIMTSSVTCEHLKMWGIDRVRLACLALRNTPRLFPPVITSMGRLLEDMTAELTPDEKPPALPLSALSSPFYVLTNRCGVNGAVCMRYPGLLKDFSASLESDLLILPSSIHEVLLIPDGRGLSFAALSRLVTRINRSDVPSQDRLSNQVYRYCRAGGRISLAAGCSAPLC